MMAAITVYGSVLSPFVARVLLTCGYKGIATELSMPKDGIKSPAFLKLNPFGKIPTIKDGSTVLYESAVIVDYIDAKYKKKKLIPSAAKAMGQARLISAISAEYVQTAGLKFFRMKRANQNVPADIEATKADLTKGMDALEKTLSSKKFAAGPSVTIADCFAIPALFFAINASALFGIADAIGSRKKIRAYWDRMQKDKVAGKILQGMSDRMKQLLAG